MNVKKLVAATLCGFSAFVSGCTDAKPETGDATQKKAWLIGMSQCTVLEPWRAQMNRDIKTAASQHPELRVIFKDASDRVANQRAQVEELVAQEIDLLIISPKESGPLDSVVKETYRSGIPVIVLDRELGHEEYSVFIGADNRQIGFAAGQWVRQTLGGKGSIVMLKGNMASSPAQKRHRGFLEGLDVATNPGLRICFEAETDWKQAQAYKEMESALATNEQIDLVYGHNDPAAYGAYLAARAAGREKSIKFVGIDALPAEGVAYVKQGILDATFSYSTCGQAAIDTALALLAKKPVPKKITLPTRRFDATSVATGGTEVK